MEFNNFAAEVAPAEGGITGYTNLPQDSWGWYEVFIGAFFGMYPVISARARDYDCWSRHINLSLRLVDLHYYFDGQFHVYDLWEWVVIMFRLISDIFSTYNLLNACKSQLDFSVWSGWAGKFKKNAAASENPLAMEGSFMMEAAPFDDDLPE
jgi:hypothetical protein